MTSDARYLAALDGVQAAADRLVPLLTTLLANCDDERGELEAGCAAEELILSGIAARSAELRRDLHVATRAFERAMQHARSTALRILIQDGERSLVDVARLTGLSESMIRRLCRANPANA